MVSKDEIRCKSVALVTELGSPGENKGPLLRGVRATSLGLSTCFATALIVCFTDSW